MRESKQVFVAFDCTIGNEKGFSLADGDASCERQVEGSLIALAVNLYYRKYCIVHVLRLHLIFQPYDGNVGGSDVYTFFIGLQQTSQLYAGERSGVVTCLLVIGC